MVAPRDSFRPVLTGGVAARPYPDYALMTHREYGHRVGVFRVLDVLEKHGITPTVAMDALTAEHYPYLVRHCLQRGCEIIGHGIGVRVINSTMSEQQEQAYIQQALDTLQRATGTAPVGWLGPEYGESARTPQLLAQAGIRYVCDWVNDEQPYAMKTSQGELYALPIMLELDDIHALWERRVPMDRYGELLKESFDILYRDGQTERPAPGITPPPLGHRPALPYRLSGRRSWPHAAPSGGVGREWGTDCRMVQRVPTGEMNGQHFI